jgi:hypothetical protein
MELFQIMISSIFSVIGATAILFIAGRAYTIGKDLSEIKELLRDAARSQHRPDTLQSGALPEHLQNPEYGNWPSVVDPEYNANSDVAYGLKTGGLKPSEPRR